MKKLCYGLSALVIVSLAAACAGNDDPNEVRESPCEWGDNRPGCEQERMECIDPQRCY